MLYFPPLRCRRKWRGCRDKNARVAVGQAPLSRNGETDESLVNAKKNASAARRPPKRLV